MVFIGYEEGTKAYRLYNPVTDRVHVSRDVVFEEDRAWNWNQAEGGADRLTSDGGDPFTVEYSWMPGGEGARGTSSPATPTAAPRAASGEPGRAHSLTPDGMGGNVIPDTTAPGGVEFVSPPTSDHDFLDDIDTDPGATLRYRTVADLLSSTNPLAEVFQEEPEEELMVAIGDGEPTTFEEAKQEECWTKAMREEMGSIEQNGTWKLVDLPRGHKAIGLKWVFKVK